MSSTGFETDTVRAAVAAPTLAVGTMSFGDTGTPAQAEALLEHALGLGITMIDTANGYAGGRTEQIIAGFVTTHRDEISIATKVGIPHPDAAGSAPLSHRGLLAAVAGSLHRLGIAQVDVLYLHQPDHDTPIEETVDALAHAHGQGWFRELGVSNYAAWQVADLIPRLRGAGLPALRYAQYAYNVVAREIEAEWLPFAAAAGITTLAYNPLAGGLLTRRHEREALPSRYTTSALHQMYRQRYLSPRLAAAVAEFGRVSEEVAIPPAELALRWLHGRSQHVDLGIVVGTDSIAHLDANVAAVSGDLLTPDLQQRITDMAGPLRSAMPAYIR